ncbi:MAG: type II toxin-antitoxin system VapC family toxin [Terriglobales bacterium]
MRYVIDASVAVKWFTPEPDSPAALRLLEDQRLEQIALTAPDLLSAEVGNALWKLSALRRKIAYSEARQSYQDFLDLALDLRPVSSLAPLALDIALTGKHTFYDSLYVALALEEQCELITADERMVRGFQSRYPFVRPLDAI